MSDGHSDMWKIQKAHLEKRKREAAEAESELAAPAGSAKARELAELVDGCYTIVELYKPQSPAQEAWRKNWLEKARRLVPGCDSLWY